MGVRKLSLVQKFRLRPIVIRYTKREPVPLGQYMIRLATGQVSLQSRPFLQLCKIQRECIVAAHSLLSSTALRRSEHILFILWQHYLCTDLGFNVAICVSKISSPKSVLQIMCDLSGFQKKGSQSRK
jgi:hypothetical protein